MMETSQRRKTRERGLIAALEWVDWANGRAGAGRAGTGKDNHGPSRIEIVRSVAHAQSSMS